MNCSALCPDCAAADAALVAGVSVALIALSVATAAVAYWRLHREGQPVYASADASAIALDELRAQLADDAEEDPADDPYAVK